MDPSLDRAYAAPEADVDGLAGVRKVARQFRVAGVLLSVRVVTQAAVTVLFAYLAEWPTALGVGLMIAQAGVAVGLWREGARFSRVAVGLLLFLLLESLFRLLPRGVTPIGMSLVVPASLEVLRLLPIAVLLIGRPKESVVSLAIRIFAAAHALTVAAVIALAYVRVSSPVFEQLK